MRSVIVRAVTFSALALGPGGCADPVHDQSVVDLGAEDPKIPAGPLHRPGQPCVLCHWPGGGAQAFAVAGTVFLEPGSAVVVPGVSVRLLDKGGRRFEASTNCAGNFFVTPAQYQPLFPLWVTLRLGEHEIEMESPILRERSCAGCHSHPENPSSAGRVFLFDRALPQPPSDCQGGR